VDVTPNSKFCIVFKKLDSVIFIGFGKNVLCKLGLMFVSRILLKFLIGGALI
jgi:hypothetical protein